MRKSSEIMLYFLLPLSFIREVGDVFWGDDKWESFIFFIYFIWILILLDFSEIFKIQINDSEWIISFWTIPNLILTIKIKKIKLSLKINTFFPKMILHIIKIKLGVWICSFIFEINIDYNFFWVLFFLKNFANNTLLLRKFKYFFDF